MLWIGGFLVLAAGLVALLALLPRVRLRRLESWRFPEYLPRRVKATYPHLSDADCDRVVEGMRQYFAIALLADGRSVAMPSQAVDVAWHEFILSTRAYQEFCARVLGRFLHHTPAEAMAPGRGQRDMRLTWALACRREGIDPRAPKALPVLFALDSALSIPDGFTYAIDCSRARAKAGSEGGDSGGGISVVYCASDFGCSGSGSSTSDGGCSGGCSGGCGGGGD